MQIIFNPTFPSNNPQEVAIKFTNMVVMLSQPPLSMNFCRSTNMDTLLQFLSHNDEFQYLTLVINFYNFSQFKLYECHLLNCMFNLVIKTTSMCIQPIIPHPLESLMHLRYLSTFKFSKVTFAWICSLSLTSHVSRDEKKSRINNRLNISSNI